MVQLSTLLALAVSTLAVSSKPVAIDSGMSSAKLSIGTNAGRIAQGMYPLPPTKRSTGTFLYNHHEVFRLTNSCKGQKIFPPQ